MDKKEFQKLQKKWYSKLAKSGFKDIENTDLPNKPLRHWDSFHFQQMWTPQAFMEKQRYFELAGQMANDFKFKKKVHGEIWKLHSQGMQSSKISKIVKIHPTNVRKIIARYAKFIKYDPN